MALISLILIILISIFQQYSATNLLKHQYSDYSGIRKPRYIPKTQKTGSLRQLQSDGSESAENVYQPFEEKYPEEYAKLQKFAEKLNTDEWIRLTTAALSKKGYSPFYEGPRLMDKLILDPQKEKAMKVGLTENEFLALHYYTNQLYEDINPALRKVNGNIQQLSDEKLEYIIKDLSYRDWATVLYHGLEKLSQSVKYKYVGTVWRGQHMKLSVWAQLPVGSIYKFNIFTSTSSSKEVAEEWTPTTTGHGKKKNKAKKTKEADAVGICFEIYLTEKAASITEFSRYVTEGEILVQPDAMFEVMEKKQDKEFRRIKLKQITKEQSHNIQAQQRKDKKLKEIQNQKKKH